MRSLNNYERAVVQALANMLPSQERDTLLQDLQHCQVESLTSDGSRLGFNLEGYARPSYVGQHPYSCEGRALDSDDQEVTVCLYADQNDRLLELELIKWSDEQIQSIRWETFTVTKP